MAFVRHGTLTAGQVRSVALPTRALHTVEILNRDAADPIYVVITKQASVEPTVNGDDTEVVMPMSALEIRGFAGAAIKMISNAAADYSIRAE